VLGSSLGRDDMTVSGATTASARELRRRRGTLCFHKVNLVRE
jgi:hypothetical protein